LTILIGRHAGTTANVGYGPRVVERTSRARVLLGLLVAAFTILPPAALPGGTATTVGVHRAGGAAAVNTGTSASVEHQLEAHRQARSSTGWPGSIPNDWPVAGAPVAGVAAATLTCCHLTVTTSADRSADPLLLLVRGRAPPSSGAPS
jgi:hypothetical protein